MNMHEWMSANPHPDRPEFDGQAFRALDGRDARQGYLGDWRSQMGDWRDQMQDWRGDRRDAMHGDQGPMMNHGPGPNTQFPLNPVQGIGQGGAPAPPTRARIGLRLQPCRHFAEIPQRPWSWE